MTLINHQQELTSQKDIQECLATIKSLHPSWNDPDPKLTLRLWHYELKHYPSQIVKRTVLEATSKSKFIPKLADVIDALKKTPLTNSDIHERDLNWYSMSKEELDNIKLQTERYLNGEEHELDEYLIERAETIRRIKEKT